MSYLPCVGCGWCCLTDQCMDSMRRHGYMRRCPDLLWDEQARRYVCRAMLEEIGGAEIRRSQHTGKGCCAPLNTWRNDIRNRDT
jgi:hypothetical protein